MSSKKTAVDRFQDHPENRLLYAEEAAVIDALEELSRQLEQSGMSRADLARSLECSRASVTQLMRGENPSIKRVAGAAYAAGGVFVPLIVPRGAELAEVGMRCLLTLRRALHPRRERPLNVQRADSWTHPAANRSHYWGREGEWGYANSEIGG